MISYDPIAREYLVGMVAGDYAYDRVSDPDHPNCRPVTWTGAVGRNQLLLETRNSPGSIATLFLLPPPPEAGDAALAGATPLAAEPAETQADDAAGEETLFEDIEAKAFEFVKDRIAKLTCSQMQDLDDQLKDLKKRIRQTGNLPDKLALQRQAREIEGRRDAAWRCYDEAAKQIEIDKDGLLDRVEAQLAQSVSSEPLFTFTFQID
ncbi:MAG: hypothetical protein HY985_18375 [Magnetospirillum sp.]|nr:hypothetical protein [Magnetospirillum sp.]